MQSAQPPLLPSAPGPGSPGLPAHADQPWVGTPPYRHVVAPAWTAVPPQRPAPKPAPFRAKELAALAAMVALADLTLWTGSARSFAAGGPGLAIFFAALPVALALAARHKRLSPRLAVVSGLLALLALRCAYDPSSGISLVALGLLFSFTLTLRMRRVFVPEAAASVLAAIGRTPSRVGAAMAGARRLVSRTRVGKVSVLPIVVPIGLCMLFAGVFALANPVVAHGLAVAWSGVTSVVGFPSIGRLFFWGVALVGAAVLLRPASRRARGQETDVTEGDATATSLLVARNALAALNVLFLVYNGLDAAYLWSGAPPAGMQTRQYAHEGAFWLTLALGMLTAVIGILFRGALARDHRAKLARTLAYAWMAQGLVLALGTYRRIAIHIGHSGLSDLRIVAILGTTLVVAGVVVVALKLRDQRTFTWLVRRQLDAFAVTVVLYTASPTHLVSARVNVARIESGEYRPLLHMFRQSTKAESAASLLPLLDHPDVRVRQGVAVLLDHERSALRREVDAETSWREYDHASRRTLAALDEAAPAIQEALGAVDHEAARQVLLEVSRVANEGNSLEELFAVPSASEWSRGARTRGEY